MPSSTKWTRPRPAGGFRCRYCKRPFRSRALRKAHIWDFHERQGPKKKGWQSADAKRGAFRSRRDIGFDV